jgi:hypothetical protein
MSTLKFITDRGIVDGSKATSNDFLGSVRTTVNPEVDVEYVLHAAKKFGWNTLVVKSSTSPVVIETTISAPGNLNNAIWIDLSQCPNAPDTVNYDTELPAGKAVMYAWEHPVTAFRFKSTAPFDIEFCSKHD